MWIHNDNFVIEKQESNSLKFTFRFTKIDKVHLKNIERKLKKQTIALVFS